MLKESIFHKKAKTPGPKIAVFAGVHGDERAGIQALQKVIPICEPLRGEVVFVYANPPAIEKNVRMVTKNLNRRFFKENGGASYEDVRARELMELLDTCDALLDLHMFYSPGEPFIICEEDSFPIAKRLNVPIVSYNWTDVEPGTTDTYMHSLGKPALCVECGAISQADEYTDLAEGIIWDFLHYFGIAAPRSVKRTDQQKYIKVTRLQKKTSPQFVLRKGYQNFQPLKCGEVIAKDSEREYTADKNECIIFPHYNARVGEEAYIIGSTV